MVVDWTQVLVTLAIGLPLSLPAIGTFILSLRNGWKTDAVTKAVIGTPATVDTPAVAGLADKVDHNTAITVGAKNQVVSAVVEQMSASNDGFDSIAKSLNGGLDAKIKKVVQEEVAVLHEAFKLHGECDDKNMKMIGDRMDFMLQQIGLAEKEARHNIAQLKQNQQFREDVDNNREAIEKMQAEQKTKETKP